jgi:hypothetical protein
MGKAQRLYNARAIRYTIRPQDDKVMRYAFNRFNNQNFSTEVVNISESGMAFTIDDSTVPHIGEIIKVEFPVPGEDRVAWFARVVRIEERDYESRWYDEHTQDASSVRPAGVIVAVKFLDLPEAHRLSIRKGLQSKLGDIKRQKAFRNLASQFRWIQHHYVQVLFFGITTLLFLGLLYFLSMNFAQKEHNRPVIWGERINQ